MPSDSRFPIPVCGLWTGQLDTISTAEAKDLTCEIEALGFGVLWLPDVVGRDVFVHLTHLLSATSTLIGATGIANIWGRDAVAMTGAVKALTEAFPERMLVGLGVSHSNIVQDLRGHRYERPLAAMRAYLEAMDRSPYSAQRPTTPVRRVIAALRPKMLQLAAELADGAHPFLVPPDHTACARQQLGDDPLLCPEQMYLLETDPARAREVARKSLAVYLGQPNYQNSLLHLGYTEEDLADGGSDGLVDSLVAWGTVDDVVARVQAHLDAGADHVCVQALTPERRQVPIGQWRELAPALSELVKK